MSLAPLLSAPAVYQVHAFAAMAAFVLGVVQLSLPKGTPWHRARGYTWVGLMAVIAVSSFWINTIRLWGPWSPIHLLSILTLIWLPLGVFYARTHRIKRHQWTMIGLFGAALVVAGIFTLYPGRIMYHVVFG